MVRAGSITLLAAVLLVVCAARWLPGIGYWLARTPEIQQADVIVVLGGGNPARILHAITLYRQGLTPELWHTGHEWSGVEMALQRGVPAEKIYFLVSTSTWEDAQQITAFARRRHVRSILVITNWWHSRRALGSIQHQLGGSGVHIYYAPVPAEPYGPSDWWQHRAGWGAVISELLKLAVYRARYGQ